METCLCGLKGRFETCCLPLIKGERRASTPEQLMRSRYSAFASQHYQYILETYIGKDKQNSQASELAEDYDGVKWVKLSIASTEYQPNDTMGYVTFSAYFGMKGKLFILTERSKFEKIDDAWFYLADESESSNERLRLSRNDTCFCGSEKKFKKCCENKLG